MIIQVSGTPTTLWAALRAQGYQIDTTFDSGMSVSIRNIWFDCILWTVTPNGVLFIEWGNLAKFDWGTNPLWEPTYIQQGWDWNNYITDTEAYPILDGETHNFVTNDLDRIFLRTCAPSSFSIYVFVE